MRRMSPDLLHPPKAHRGDRIAVLSLSFAAAGAFPAVHEQAMRRLIEVTGLVPVEYPTTRMLGASPQARAPDINDALPTRRSAPSSRSSAATIRSPSSRT